MMLRTPAFFIEFGLSLLALTPKLKTARDLKKTNPRASFLYTYNIGHNWVQNKLKISGGEFMVLGRENIPPEPRACVFIGNHQSDFDIPMITGLIDKPLSFVAKKEMKRVPLLRDWMELLNCVFIDRESPRQSMEAILEGIRLVKGGNSMVIYPEGSRSKDGIVREFKAGSFKLATKAGAPIVPVAVEGTYKLFEGNSRLIRPARVWMSFLPAIETAGLAKDELAALPERVEGMIRSEVQRLRELEETTP